MKPTWDARYALLIATLAIFVQPLLWFGILAGVRENLSDLTQWLPDREPETERYRWFLEHFGSGEVAVVSWPGCRYDDPRLESLAKALEARHGCGIRHVWTGGRAVRDLATSRGGIPADEAIERLQGILIGPDGTTSAAVVMVQSEELDRQAVVQAIRDAARSTAGIAPEELHLGGPLVTTAAIEVESGRSLHWLIAASIGLAIVLGWGALRSIQLTAIVFAAAALCQGMSIAIVYYTGGQMNAVLLMMPALVYVLGLSGAVHLINYYRGAIPHHGPAGAPAQMVAHGWLPGLLAAGTTVLGVGSLCVSGIDLVRDFGFYAAIGVTLSLPILFLILPAALQLWPPQSEAKGVPRVACPPVPSELTLTPSARPVALACADSPSQTLVDKPPVAPEQPQADTPLVPTNRPYTRCRMQMLCGFSMRHHQAITIGACCVLALFAAGLYFVRPLVKLESLFPASSRVLQDHAWLESHLGPQVPLEVLLHFEQGPAAGLSFDERMACVTEAETALAAIEGVGGTMSAATFTTTVAEEGSALWHAVQRQARGKRLHAQFLAQHYLLEVDAEEIWRITARVAEVEDRDYGVYLERAQAAIAPVVARWQARGAAPLTASFTGVTPVIDRAQQQLLGDLTESFTSGALLIGLVMIVALRSLGAGLVAMLPNVLPVVMIFGGMGWLGMLVDVGAMMTASIALGIAVDDTIHYLIWFHRGLDAGLSTRRAIRQAYAHCAVAMTQTAIICGLGLLVFSGSSFLPTVRFSWLMCTILLVALACDLLVLPALLVGPLGRFFRKRKLAAG